MDCGIVASVQSMLGILAHLGYWHRSRETGTGHSTTLIIGIMLYSKLSFSFLDYYWYRNRVTTVQVEQYRVSGFDCEYCDKILR